MGDVVNLNKARKAQARQRAQSEAAENRVRFGRTKAERKAQDSEQKRQALVLDGHALTEREHHEKPRGEKIHRHRRSQDQREP